MINLLQKNPAVLILGTNDQTTKLIRLLNKKYDIIPILFDNRRPTKKIFSYVRYIFWHQKLPNNNYYIVHTILDIAESLHEGCRILLPCTSHFENIIKNNFETFENEYIICHLNDIRTLLFNPINSK